MNKVAGWVAAAVLAVSVFMGGAVPVVKAAPQKTYLINFKGDYLPSNARSLVEKANGKVLKADEALGYIEAASGDTRFLENIRQETEVANANEELVLYQKGTIAKEPLEGNTEHPLYEQYQWDIKQVTQDGQSYQLPGGKGSKNVVVAVIDTGIDMEHPDLKANIVEAKSFVPGESPQDVEGHGSHVAGSIAANGNVLGIGPELGIASLKVFPKDGGAPTSWIVDAIRYAADQDYDVINMSLGDYLFLQDPNRDTSDITADINLFKKAIAYAHNKGVTIVGSAGNANADISKPGQLSRYLFDENGATKRDPASNLLIRVAAGNKSKQRTFYSNYGNGKIDVMAPGGDLGPHYDPITKTGRDPSYLCLSTVPVVDQQGNVIGHGYARYAGTSMAAPKVAGVAGVIIAKHGKNQLSPSQVKSIIQQSSEDIYKTGYDAESGFGYVNAVSALRHR
ncbi:serine protease [Marinithermofilum abyssi]|uniref:Serine protease n=1 Tax=Marinithermofilum abyssi TaxID=1571185 RepID=A0A8J2VFT9_9BACL|nr:S8 family serine peptidase [Marinithermofilum abyssi]GGE04157.1 serine protease [Marinithermofilum abyssi]